MNQQHRYLSSIADRLVERYLLHLLRMFPTLHQSLKYLDLKQKLRHKRFESFQHHGLPSCRNGNHLLYTLLDRKSTRLNSSHVSISYAVFCLKKKTSTHTDSTTHACQCHYYKTV